MEANASFGAAVREFRRAAGMSLRQLAEKLGLSAPFLCDVEHGRRGVTDEAALIKALGVTEEKLLGRVAILSRREIEWINANPNVVEMLRKLRRRSP